MFVFNLKRGAYEYEQTEDPPAVREGKAERSFRLALLNELADLNEVARLILRTLPGYDPDRR